MRRKGIGLTITCAVLAIALAVVLAACYFTLKYFVVVDWQLFPRNQDCLLYTSDAADD